MTITQKMLDELAEMTDANAHTEARVLIAQWAVNQAEPDTTFAHIAGHAYEVLNAIQVLHNEIGYLPDELYRLRHDTTAKLLEAVGAIDAAAATWINAAL